MFTKSKITQSMIDAVNSVVSEEKKKLLLEPELDETGFHKAAHAAKKANQTHFEFQGKKYPVTAKSHAEAIEMDEAASEKVPTPTGMKVYGHRYGNAAKAHRDQTKHDIDKIKEPKDKDLKEEGDCVTEPEAKNIAKKEVKGHEKKMHHAEEMTLGHKWKEKAKAKIKENKGNGPQETFTDNNMGEEVHKSDVPAYIRKAKGEKPLTVADVKGPKKGTISHPENLAKARNEEVVTEAKGIPVAHGYTMHQKHAGKYRVHSPSGEHVGDVEKEGNMWRYHGSSNPNWPGTETHKDYQTDKVENKHEAGDIVAHLHHSGMKNEEYELDEAKVTTPDDNPNRITTDMIKGREDGGKSNAFKPFKLKLKSDGEMKAPEMEEPEDSEARKSIKPQEPKTGLKNVKESNDSHTHAAHYEDPKTGEWTGMQLITAKDDDDAIKQAHEKCKEGCRLSKVEKHTTVKEESEKWIQKAIKKPGAETAAAHKAGMSTHEYMEKHKHDSGKAGKRARLGLTLSKMHKEEAELDEQLNEVLSKDASAGDWIHDFIHSKNPKFAGKSKAERKKMALGAYYGKKNEETDSSSWKKETPWMKSHSTVTDKSGAKHTPMSRARNLARQAFKKVQDKTKIKSETMMGKAGTTSESKKKW